MFLTEQHENSLLPPALRPDIILHSSPHELESSLSAPILK